jgi:hypothetical protein
MPPGGEVGDNITVMLATVGSDFERLLMKMKHCSLDLPYLVFARIAGQIALPIYFEGSTT